MALTKIAAELAKLRAQMQLLREREAELLASLPAAPEPSALSAPAPRPGWPVRRVEPGQHAGLES